jgi:hypothetical protein
LVSIFLDFLFFFFFFLFVDLLPQSTKRESIVRMMMVSQKNADGGQQRQSVSLVMVSAKGRVAVYDLSLKLAAAFTLRLSSAPVASIKAPLSIPSAASGTSANSRPNAPAAPSTAITSYNAGSSQKVFFFFSFVFFLNSTSSKCLNYNAHSMALDSFFSPLYSVLCIFNMRKECLSIVHCDWQKRE